MTPLRKRVTRRSDETVRDRGRHRRIIVTLYPSGWIGLRLEKTRRTEQIPLAAAYSIAVKMRVAQERAERRKRRK